MLPSLFEQQGIQLSKHEEQQLFEALPTEGKYDKIKYTEAVDMIMKENLIDDSTYSLSLIYSHLGDKESGQSSHDDKEHDGDEVASLTFDLFFYVMDTEQI